MSKALFFDVSGEIRPILVGPRDEDFPVLREYSDYYLHYVGRGLHIRLDVANERLRDYALYPNLPPVNLALRHYFPNSWFVGPAIIYCFGLPEGEDPTDDEDAAFSVGVLKDLLPSHLDYLSRLKIVYATRCSGWGPLLFRWGIFIVDPEDPSDFEGLEAYSDVPVPETLISARDVRRPFDFAVTVHLEEDIIDHREPGGAYDQYVRARRLAETEIEARFNFAKVLEVVKLLPKKG